MNAQELLKFTKVIAGYRKRENDLMIMSTKAPSPVRLATGCEESDIREILEHDNEDLDYLMSKEYEDSMSELNSYLTESFNDVNYDFHSNKDGRIDVSFIDIKIGNPVVIIVHVMMRDPKYVVIEACDSDGNELVSSITTGVYSTHKENNDSWVKCVNQWVNVYNKMCGEGEKGKEVLPHVQNRTYVIYLTAQNPTTTRTSEDFVIVNAPDFDTAFTILENSIAEEPNMTDMNFLECLNNAGGFNNFVIKTQDEISRVYINGPCMIAIAIANIDDYLYVGGHE